MRKRLLATLILGAGLLPHAAHAEVLDVATVKCSELSGMSDEDGSFLFAWLLGYAGGQAGITTLDLDDMENIGKEIGDYCAANPDVGVLSATSEVMTE